MNDETRHISMSGLPCQRCGLLMHAPPNWWPAWPSAPGVSRCPHCDHEMRLEYLPPEPEKEPAK